MQVYLIVTNFLTPLMNLEKLLSKMRNQAPVIVVRGNRSHLEGDRSCHAHSVSGITVFIILKERSF